MPAQKLMFIRHAEKPSTGVAGVTLQGAANAEELIVQGWQRAGALARFFAPLKGSPAPGLLTPQALFASQIAHHSESLRPQHTILPLSQPIGVTIQTPEPKGKEKDLAKILEKQTVPTLIAWEHQDIPTIINHLAKNKTLCPQTWTGTRFDMVWVLDRSDATSPWSFSQVPQMLLAGDSPDPIPFQTTAAPAPAQA